MRPIVVLISGMPGSGKTTLARTLSDELHLPVVSRDDIKIGMHVTAESTDPAEVRRFSGEAFEVFFATVQTLSGAGVSLIAEAAFHRDRSAASFLELQKVADVAHLATGVVESLALERYRQRAERGERHPAHADLLNLDRLQAESEKYRLDFPEPMLPVDTASHEYRPGLPEICRFIDRCRT